MTTRLRRISSETSPGYRVEVDGTYVGEVFKTEHPMFPSITIWYPYPPDEEYPLDPDYQRRDAVANLVDSWNQEHP